MLKQAVLCVLLLVPGSSVHTAKNVWAKNTACVHSESMVHFESAYAQLQAIGSRAHEIWQDYEDTQEIVKHMADLFAAVEAPLLTQVIDEIVNDDQLLAKVTQASYKNVTGFLKLVLLSNNNHSWKLRIHIWDQDGVEYPHNHKWDFCSKIVQGQLLQKIYQENDRVDQDGACLYSVREPVSMMPLLPNGQKACPCRDFYKLDVKDGQDEQAEKSEKFVALSIGDVSILHQGDIYFMPGHLIHTIQPSRDAITFVFTSEQISANSEVFVPQEETGNEIVLHAPSVTVDEVREGLLSLKRQLLPMGCKQ